MRDRAEYMARRRRPGERAKTHRPESLGGYPLDADKRLRAKAAFLRQSLGDACHAATEQFPCCVQRSESFLGREKADCRPGEILTDREIQLMIDVADRRKGWRRSNDLPAMLADEIERAILQPYMRNLARARRARQRAAVHELSERIRISHAPLAADALEDVPY
jgi:hypothetical protein